MSCFHWGDTTDIRLGNEDFCSPLFVEDVRIEHRLDPITGAFDKTKITLRYLSFEEDISYITLLMLRVKQVPLYFMFGGEIYENCYIVDIFKELKSDKIGRLELKTETLPQQVRDTIHRGRKCWLCDKNMHFNEFKRANKGKVKDLEKQWESEYVQIMCCECIKLIEDIKDMKKQSFAYLDLLEQARNGRRAKLLKLKELGVF